MSKKIEYFVIFLAFSIMVLNFFIIRVYCSEIKANDEFIKIVYPNSSTILKQGDSTYVEWQGAEGSRVNIFIYKGDVFIGEFIKSGENNGHAYRLTPIPYSWSAGNDFKLIIEDESGNVGMSENFTISNNIINLKIDFSITIPQFGSDEQGISSILTTIIWYEKDSSFLLSNDINIVELYYDGVEINIQKSFGSLMKSTSIRGLEKINNLIWGVDVKSFTILGVDWGTSGEKYKLPKEISDPSGFTYDSSYYYVSDIKTNKAYKLDKNGNELVIKNSLTLTEKPIRDIRWHDNSFWVCDENKIYVYDKEMTLIKVFKVPAVIDGITFYNNEIWACGLGKEELYKFLLPP